MNETTVNAIREALEIIRTAIENELENAQNVATHDDAPESPQPTMESEKVPESPQPVVENDETQESHQPVKECGDEIEHEVVADGAADNSAETKVVENWRAEHELSDDDFDAFANFMRQLELAITGNSITAEILDVIYKGIHHDEDVDTARNDGEVCGRNQRIEMQRRDDINMGTHSLSAAPGNVSVVGNMSPLFNRASRPSIWERK